MKYKDMLAGIDRGKVFDAEMMELIHNGTYAKLEPEMAGVLLFVKFGHLFLAGLTLDELAQTTGLSHEKTKRALDELIAADFVIYREPVYLEKLYWHPGKPFFMDFSGKTPRQIWEEVEEEKRKYKANLGESSNG